MSDTYVVLAPCTNDKNHHFVLAVCSTLELAQEKVSKNRQSFGYGRMAIEKHEVINEN